MPFHTPTRTPASGRPSFSTWKSSVPAGQAGQQLNVAQPTGGAGGGITTGADCVDCRLGSEAKKMFSRRMCICGSPSNRYIQGFLASYLMEDSSSAKSTAAACDEKLT